MPRGTSALSSNARRIAWGAGAATAVGIATVAWAALETHRYVLHEVTVPVLPSGSGPIRVLHISDLHLIPGQADKIAWLRDLSTVEPDLVVNTGDNFGHRDALWPLFHALEPLLDIPGAFVLGSNDYFAPSFRNPLRYLAGHSGSIEGTTNEPDLPWEQFSAVLEDAGWTNLDNRRTGIRIRGQVIDMVGLGDPHIGRDELPAPTNVHAVARTSSHAFARTDGADTAHSDDLEVATAGNAHLVEKGLDAVRLGLVHAPYRRALDALAQDGADLILVGHTHGGQICLPGYGALTTNCDLDRGRVKGLSRWSSERGGSGERGGAGGSGERGGATGADTSERSGAGGSGKRGGSGGTSARGATAENYGDAMSAYEKARDYSGRDIDPTWLHVSEGVGTNPFVRLRLACRPAATLLTLVGR